MSYSITPILHTYGDKQGLRKVLLRIIYNRIKLYVPTAIKVPEDNFEKGLVVKHKNKKPFNDEITRRRHEIETKILDAMKRDQLKTKSDLEDVIKGRANRNLIFEFIYELIPKLKGKITEGRLKHYKVIANKLEEYDSNVTFGDISVGWMNKFEAWLRSKGLDGNTVLSNMSLLIAILNKAYAENLIDQKQYHLYKRPSYNQKLVEYLTEEELLRIKAAVDATGKPSYKRAGYYFLLSAFTGYRISDSKRFNYEEMVKGDMIVLRATKNKQIVSIPLYGHLKEVLEFVKENPLNLSEDKTRKYVKEICKFVGIKKDVNYHMSRHSFAMFLIDKGFSIDEVARLLGDSPEVARIYAYISNPHLKARVDLLLN